MHARLTYTAVILQFRANLKDGQDQHEDADHEYKRTDYYKPSDRVPARQSSHLDLQVSTIHHHMQTGRMLAVVYFG